VKNLVILISGRGSNMQAILRAALPLRVAAVVSNRQDAAGLEVARRHGVETVVVEHGAHPSRQAFDDALAAAIDRFAPDFVALAGFMRILTPAFVAHYAGRLVNIHPSLLPAFTGLDTHARALDAGVKIHGCTVHFVTDALDGGPIIAQAAVPVLPGDDAETLAARVLAQEHRLYPQVLAWLAAGKLERAPDGIVRFRGAASADSVLVSPQEVS
jgi:phosphoribosylglycinamide formyltransferase-1